MPFVEYQPTPASKCRIVQYHSEIDGEVAAAIVTKVNPDGTVNLAIFPEDGGLDFRRHVPHNPGKFGGWGYPPRV